MSLIFASSCVLPHLSAGGCCLTGSTGQRIATGLDEWSWCSAEPPCEFQPVKTRLFTGSSKDDSVTVRM